MVAALKSVARQRSRADEIVDLIDKNIRAFNTSPRQVDNPLCEHRRTLEDDMSWQACTSPAAAMLKIALILSDADSALSHLPDGHHYQAVMTTLSRQCGSLIRWIEKEFRVDRADYSLDYYHTDWIERPSWGLALDGAGEIPS